MAPVMFVLDSFSFFGHQMICDLFTAAVIQLIPLFVEVKPVKVTKKN